MVVRGDLMSTVTGTISNSTTARPAQSNTMSKNGACKFISTGVFTTITKRVTRATSIQRAVNLENLGNKTGMILQI